MRIPLPVAGGTKQARSFLVNNQLLQNYYYEPGGAGSKAVAGLYPTPGLTLTDTIANGEGRSRGVVFQGLLYMVVGDTLFGITSGGAATAVGTLLTSTGRVSITKGRNHVALVDGQFGYTYDGVTPLQQITDIAFPANPTHITYLDARFIVNQGGTDNFFISALEDATSWNALNFAVAESNPDNILAHRATEKELILIGSETAQVYYNSFDADFPFTPYANGVLEFGILAPHSLAKGADGMFWLAEAEEGGAAVVMLSGLSPSIVSTDAINWQIDQLDVKADAYGQYYRHAGRPFYCLTFPSSGKTFVYDPRVGPENGWHVRSSADLGYWRVGGIGYLNQSFIATDTENGNLYKLDYRAFTEAGDEIIRKRRTQVSEANNLNIDWGAVTLEVGSGITSLMGGSTSTVTEHITNGEFIGNINGWTEALDTVIWVAGDRMRLTDELDSSAARQQASNINVGAVHTVTIDIFSLAAGDQVTVNIGSSAGASDIASQVYTTAGVMTFDFTPTGATVWVDLVGLDPPTGPHQVDLNSFSITSTVTSTTIDDPKLKMRYSDDGGFRWSRWLTVSLGKQGEFGRILRWFKLGQSRGRIFEFHTAAAIDHSIVNGYADANTLND